MNKDLTYVNHCPICNSPHHKYFSSGKDYELETITDRFLFVKCDVCSHVWLNPRPSSNLLPIIYPSSYYSYNMSNTLNPLILKGKDLLDHLKMRSILAVTKNIFKYLDIGCGDGRYMKSVRNATGLPKESIIGIELDEKPVEKLRKEGYLASNIRVEDITANFIPNDSISLITMFHVIEHVEDPVHYLKKIYNLLHSEGIFAVETPNLDSLDATIFKRSFWGGYHFPRHWHLFTSSGLINVLNDIGFKIESVQYKTGHSFWLYSFHHLLKYKLRLELFAKLFDPMKSKFFLVVFTIFDIIRAKLGFKTSAVLVICKK